MGIMETSVYQINEKKNSFLKQNIWNILTKEKLSFSFLKISKNFDSFVKTPATLSINLNSPLTIKSKQNPRKYTNFCIFL
jgi:hypothetical protein